MTNGLLLEACVETPTQCLNAQNAGADRLELCGRLDLDGLTPTMEVVKEVKKIINIPFKVIVRPRPGNFVHSNEEVDEMIQSIQEFQSIGINQFVIGILNEHQEIDESKTRKIVNLFPEAVFTIHKCIDETKDPINALEALIPYPNIKYVLTSGKAKTALEGAEMLREMIQKSRGRITIISAGKITKSNLENVLNVIGGSEYHGKRIVN